MALSTYSELTTELDAWLNRSDLSARVPTFVKLFESRMNRILRVPQMETVATQPTTASIASYALPTDCLSVREVYLDEDDDSVLAAMSPSHLRSTYAEDAEGEPEAYAITGETLVLGPVPSGTYTLAIDYYKAIPALSTGNTTNWLLTDYPDAYLWGALTMAEAYLKDDARTEVWKSAWDECMAEILKDAIRRRTPAAPLHMRPGSVA